MDLMRYHHRLSQEEMAVILDSVADGVFTIDRDFTITSFNRSAEQITGFSAEEAIGQRCYNIFRTSVCQGECLLAESIRTGRPISGMEITILNRDNREVPISVSTSTLQDRQGRVIGGVETFRDLTAVQGLRKEIRQRYALGDMLSKNHRMREIFGLVPDIAASKATVLIQGETGTGKELLARSLHSESPRSAEPFVAVNCAALPDSLLESELFGHVAGAFTDARTARAGRFKQADGGTIFLDEIGDMSLAMQAKLLRVLEEGTFEPLGSNRSERCDVRVIAATHRNLKQRVGEGAFRQDLFYRINTVVLTLPPLRERKEDIPLLVEHFIERFTHLMGKNVQSLAGDAMQALLDHDWPGNVRELEHALEHAFVLSRAPVIEKSALPHEITSSSVRTNKKPSGTSARDIIESGERQALLQVLQNHHWNRQSAAQALGVSRTTLWRKMKAYGLAD